MFIATQLSCSVWSYISWIFFPMNRHWTIRIGCFIFRCNQQLSTRYVAILPGLILLSKSHHILQFYANLYIKMDVSYQELYLCSYLIWMPSCMLIVRHWPVRIITAYSWIAFIFWLPALYVTYRVCPWLTANSRYRHHNGKLLPNSSWFTRIIKENWKHYLTCKLYHQI